MAAASVPRKERQRRQRERTRAVRDAARLEAARRQEAADEDIAPAIQRLGVAGYSAPRLVRDGVTFIRSNPIRHIVERGGLTSAHERAAERLSRTLEDGGQGVGQAASAYGERTSATAQTGWISEDQLARIGYQNRCKAEFAAAQVWLGSLWPVVRSIVLEGKDLTTVAPLMGHADRRTTRGYLQAALDRLIEFYAAVDERRERRGAASQIRSAFADGRGDG